MPCVSSANSPDVTLDENAISTVLSLIWSSPQRGLHFLENVQTAYELALDD